MPESVNGWYREHWMAITVNLFTVKPSVCSQAFLPDKCFFDDNDSISICYREYRHI